MGRTGQNNVTILLSGCWTAAAGLPGKNQYKAAVLGGLGAFR